MWELLNPKILVLSRPKFGGFAQHIGVQLPDGRVAHCVPGHGVVVTSVEQYAGGEDVTIVREVPWTLHWDLMQRLSSALAERRPYHPLSWNCEVFANWLIGEKPESAQAKGWLVVALVAALAKIASS
jgi:hypothetical protein